jgi:hypothetical protein
MRTALCLYGLIGNTGSKSGYSKSDTRVLEIASKNYLKNLIVPNNADVFLHTWDTQLENEVRSAFSPCDAIFEEQIVFDIPSHVQANGASNSEKRKQNHYSMWYSVKKTVELKRKWEEKNNFKYDCVMIGRFDVSWETMVDFSSFDMKKNYTGRWCRLIYKGKDIYNAGRGIFFEIKDRIDMSQVQHTHKFEGDVPNQGLSCIWFFGNSEDMDNFSLLYDHLDTYTLRGQCPTMELTISSHRLSQYHLKQIGIYKNLERVFHKYCDYPLVRTKYFGSKE